MVLSRQNIPMGKIRTLLRDKKLDKKSQIKRWSQLYGRQITEEEYREICDNLKGFFDTLREWDKAGKEKPQAEGIDIS